MKFLDTLKNYFGIFEQSNFFLLFFNFGIFLSYPNRILFFECTPKLATKRFCNVGLDFHRFDVAGDMLVSAEVSITLNVAAKGIMKINAAMLAVVLESKSCQ